MQVLVAVPVTSVDVRPLALLCPLHSKATSGIPTYEIYTLMFLYYVGYVCVCVCVCVWIVRKHDSGLPEKYAPKCVIS